MRLLGLSILPSAAAESIAVHQDQPALRRTSRLNWFFYPGMQPVRSHYAAHRAPPPPACFSAANEYSPSPDDFELVDARAVPAGEAGQEAGPLDDLLSQVETCLPANSAATEIRDAADEMFNLRCIP